MEFQGEHALPDQLATNLPKTACKIDIAYFVIQGQDDIVTPTQAVVDYFKCVRAPKKELILIPSAGHFAFMTAASEFLELLKSKVRPVALARGGPLKPGSWLEWGSSTAGQSLPAALLCFRVVYSDSISTVPHSRLQALDQPLTFHSKFRKERET
ncbi:MAG TPA: hypothetical protein VIX19_08370, partial [Terriglobales bacterium]